MADIKTDEIIRVVLRDDKEEHARGSIAASKLFKTDLLQRNKRFYRFSTCQSGTLIFVECELNAYIVTEF